MMRGEDKITVALRQRMAYVYIRQSTAHQVRHHLQSQERQYELTQVAQTLGWHEENIGLIDEDLGQSGTDQLQRTGFQRLRREIAEGSVGAVFCLETSRLARNNRDWYHLLDLCAVSGTLVADPGGIYDPRDYEDRMHLGLKGILSEAELHLLRSRLLAGQLHKAQKGELVKALPPGFVKDEDGRIVLDPDRNVQHTVRTILEKFEELGSVRKVVRWMHQEGVQMPRRVGAGILSRVEWRRPRHFHVCRLLRNPHYAGAYFYGRQQTHRRVEGEEVRVASRQVPMEKWKVLLREAHPGYIGRERYLRNQERLHQNAAPFLSSGASAAGRGAALAQGILRCGSCGRYMVVNYRAEKDSAKKRRSRWGYRCERGRVDLEGSHCTSIHGPLIDGILAEARVSAVEAANIEATLAELQGVGEHAQAARRHWELRVEKSEYEAERAQRQYELVEPENRLVAAELERRWNERLKELKDLGTQHAEWSREQRQWTLEEMNQVRDLMKDVRTLWAAPQTTWEDRKGLVRLLVQEVWVKGDRAAERLQMKILWRGDTVTLHEARWRIKNPGNENVVERIRHWAGEGCDDEEMAAKLNAEGLRMGTARPFGRYDVQHYRRRHGIGLAHRGYTMREAAQRLGVNFATVALWVKRGLLQAEHNGMLTHWRIRLTDEDIARLRPSWNPETEWTVPQAAEYWKVPLWKVRHEIARHGLPAREMRVGLQRFHVLPAKAVRTWSLRDRRRKTIDDSSKGGHREA